MKFGKDFFLIVRMLLAIFKAIASVLVTENEDDDHNGDSLK